MERDDKSGQCCDTSINRADEVSVADAAELLEKQWTDIVILVSKMKDGDTIIQKHYVGNMFATKGMLIHEIQKLDESAREEERS